MSPGWLVGRRLRALWVDAALDEPVSAAGPVPEILTRSYRSGRFETLRLWLGGPGRLASLLGRDPPRRSRLVR
jgi:hypothetical protein